MKIVKIMIILLISALLLSACSRANQPSTASGQIPDDFGFIYIYDFIEVDTFNGTIKNTYHFSEGNPDAIKDFSFSQEDLQKIYEAFIRYGIQKLPEEIDPNKDFMRIPPSYYELQYTSDGETKKVSYRKGDNNNFVKFMMEVWNYIHESDAYQLLPFGPAIE